MLLRDNASCSSYGVNALWHVMSSTLPTWGTACILVLMLLYSLEMQTEQLGEFVSVANSPGFFVVNQVLLKYLTSCCD